MAQNDIPDFPGTGPDAGVDVIAQRQYREQMRMAEMAAQATDDEPEQEAFDNSEARRVIALEAALRVTPAGTSAAEVIGMANDLYNYVKDGTVPTHPDPLPGPQTGARDAGDGPEDGPGLA